MILHPASVNIWFRHSTLWFRWIKQVLVAVTIKNQSVAQNQRTSYVTTRIVFRTKKGELTPTSWHSWLQSVNQTPLCCCLWVRTQTHNGSKCLLTLLRVWGAELKGGGGVLLGPRIRGWVFLLCLASSSKERSHLLVNVIPNQIFSTEL